MTTKLEGLHFSRIGLDEIYFTIHIESMMQHLEQLRKEGKFVDGRLQRLKEPSKKGVTHLPIIKTKDDTNNPVQG